MDLLSSLALGFTTAISPLNLAYCFFGVLLGTLIGVLPGIGPTTTMALLLPFTYGLEPTGTLIMLSGIYYGAQYGGSTTAILINVPGEVSSVVTTLDGHAMARQGRAGPALAIAAIGSFVAGSVATLFIAVFAPSLTAIALSFGPAEYFSLVLLGLTLCAVLSSGSVVKALAMIAVGLLFSFIGSDLYTGVQRFTLGIPNLFNGLDFTVVVIGLFGISEILRNLEQEQGKGDFVISAVNDLVPTRKDLAASTPSILRGTAIGTFLGLFPGSGATLASIGSYALERRIAKNPERFGHGAIEGVAGPESANNAAAQTSFIPLLTLGIPSNSVMALMAGAMLMTGIAPGPNVMADRPGLMWGLIVSMWIGNLMLVVLNLPLVGLWVRLVAIPYRILFPSIIVIATLAAFAVETEPANLYFLAGFGVFGYVMAKLGCEPAPLLYGFVLGDLLEEHFRRAMLISRGSLMIFVERPISAVFLVLVAVLLMLAVVPAIRRSRAALA